MESRTGSAALRGQSLADRNVGELKAKLSEKEVSAPAAAQVIRLLEYAISQGLSIKQLEDKTRISIGTLSPLFAANYPGNYDRIARRIETFFIEEENTRIFGGCRDFVKTKVSESLWKIFEKTRYNRRIQIIQSEEQLGKTRSATEYAHAHNSGRTVLVTLQPGGTSNPFGVFLRDMAKATGVTNDGTRRIMDVRFGIRGELEGCDLVLIDEFHAVEKWSDRAVSDLLDYIRTELHCDGSRGVVIIATNSDVMTLLQSFRKRTRYNIGQLLGRMCNEIVQLYPDEVPLDDVRLLVERYYKPSKATLQKLYDLACRPKLGHFGLLDDIMSRAWADSQLDGVPLTDELVISKARETLEGIEKRSELYK